jgi:hypothetical protein
LKLALVGSVMIVMMSIVIVVVVMLNMLVYFLGCTAAIRLSSYMVVLMFHIPFF